MQRGKNVKSVWTVPAWRSRYFESIRRSPDVGVDALSSFEMFEL